MTPRQLRAALSFYFAASEFAAEGPRFVRHTLELTHKIEIAADRRLPGVVQIYQHIFPKGQTQPLLSEELASYGFHSAFPRAWSATSVDGHLLLNQVIAIYQAFQTILDVAHFFSDRHRRDNTNLLPERAPAVEANSLSAAETLRELRRLGNEILNEGFTLVSGRANLDLWASNLEVEGFRHCAYLEANYSSTMAVLNTCALPSKAIAKRLRGESELRLLYSTPKHILYAAGRPVLMPLAIPCADLTYVRLALNEYVGLHPPHLLPR